MARRGRFPWGLLLLAGAGYLAFVEYKKSQVVPSAPATPAPTPLLPAPVTTTTALPVTAPTPAQLQQPLSNRQIVLQTAQTDGRPAWLNFAQNGTDAEMAAMANIITTEWDVYGRCHTDQCTTQWAAIAAKYNLY